MPVKTRWRKQRTYKAPTFHEDPKPKKVFVW